jgi:hypothetical protein
MWIIASIPFWLLGTACLTVSILGGWLCYRKDESIDDMKTTTVGVVTFMVLAGLLFIIAAKVAS